MKCRNVSIFNWVNHFRHQNIFKRLLVVSVTNEMRNQVRVNSVEILRLSKRNWLLLSWRAKEISAKVWGIEFRRCPIDEEEHKGKEGEEKPNRQWVGKKITSFSRKCSCPNSSIWTCKYDNRVTLLPLTYLCFPLNYLPWYLYHLGYSKISNVGQERCIYTRFVHGLRPGPHKSFPTNRYKEKKWKLHHSPSQMKIIKV